MGDVVRFTLRALAEALGAALEGDPDVVVRGIAPLENAGSEHISFLTDDRYLSVARSSRAGAFLTGVDTPSLPAPMLRAKSPKLALIGLLRMFHTKPAVAAGIHPAAVVAAGASVDPSASVGAFAVIEERAVIGARARLFPFVYVGREAEIGEDATVYPHAVLLERVRIGRRVIVHPGVVLGGDGFGYASESGIHHKIPQVGGVVIEDDVEIGANTTIDRSTMGDTLIGHGTKIDNLVQIAHNARVGPASIIAAQAGIAGSGRVGRGSVLGGQAGVSDHVTVADGVMLAAGAGALTDLPDAGRYVGLPARPAVLGKRIWILEARLPELFRRLRDVERRLEAVQRQIGYSPPAHRESR